MHSHVYTRYTCEYTHMCILTCVYALTCALTSGSRFHYTDYDKAETLNQQFQSVFTAEDTTDVPALDGPPYDQMDNIHFTPAGIEDQLRKLHPHKACGMDEIPTRLLREIAAEVAGPLCLIFQQSYDARILPDIWRDAMISAVFKKGSRSEPDNYRPISLTCICAKVMEHIVCSQMMHHFDDYDILSHHQHGFRRGMSCTTQLISVIQDWSVSLDKRIDTDVIFLDFSKAFDTVPHSRLLSKLDHYGVTGRTNNWIRAFLHRRRQCLTVNAVKSGWADVRSGVPQGTVLGPILFLIYINDIATVVSSDMRLFADDSMLYRKMRCNEDAEQLQRDLHSLWQWSLKWQMCFKPAKCFHMTITCRRYQLGGRHVQTVHGWNYLGVTLSSNLSFKSHCDNTCAKALRTLGMVQRTLHPCARKTKATAYKVLVRPILEYATPAWSPHRQADVDKLERVQRKAARFACGDYRRRSSVTDMLRALGWNTLQQRRAHHDVTLFYKIHRREMGISVPPTFRQPADPVSRGHPQRYLQPHTRIDVFKHSFYPRTVRAWNALPWDVVAADSVSAFKSATSMLADRR